MTQLAGAGRGAGSDAPKAAPSALGMTAKVVALALVVLWSAPVLHAATASVEGNVLQVLATGDGRFGGCMAALDVAPADAGLDCPGQWVTLDCVGEYAGKEGVGRMVESLRAAVVTGKSVEMRVTDEKKHGGYCYASRIKIQDEPHEDGDSDADGVLDLDDDVPLDASETVDTDDDGTGDGADADDDNDGVDDADDAFPLDPSESVDTDGDGTGDNADADDDNDGIPDVEDSCPLDPDNGCPLPDLIVDSASANPVTVGEGESFTFSVTVRNRGTGRSDATMLRYFRSTDAAISTSDPEVGTHAVAALAAGASSAESIPLTAPSGAGTYYYRVCVDAVAGESDTGNNCSGGVEVEVLDDGSALLDGVIEIDAPGTPGNLCVYGPGAFPVVVGASGAGRAPVVAAGRWGAGRVVALGHDGYLLRRVLETADTGRLMTNALLWASGNDRPRIGVVGSAQVPGAQLRGWLVEASHDAVEVELTPAALGTVDVVVLALWDQSTTETAALSAFVRGGGGLVAAATGWAASAYLHPHLDHASVFAGNRLLKDFGIGWGREYLARTSDIGFAVEGLPSDLTHAGRALNAVDDHETGKSRLTEPETAQATKTVVAAIHCAHPDDEVFAPAVRALTEKNDHWPTQTEPVGETDALARIASAFVVKSHGRTPAESIREHPTAADFPGPVPTDARRISRSVTIDTSVPDWHSTGLYAAPGEVVKVTMPDKVASLGGFHIRVGAHSDRIWGHSEWRRMPEISRRFPVSASSTPVASAFGGLIYVEVPTGAGLGSISVDIDGAVAAPRFVIGQTDLEAWRDEVRHAPAPWAEIAGKNMIVTTDVREVRHLDNPVAVAETWDRVVELITELAAWAPTVRSRPERFVVDRQISAGSMHAGYPIMAHLDQSANLVNAGHLRSEGNWGFFREVGHNYQNYDWTFDGTVEVTVNLFTLYVYEFLCGIPVAENPNGSAEFQAKQMARYDFNAPDFEQWKREPFLALVMYEQLQQAFGWDAYRRVFAAYLALPAAERPKSDDEKRDQWLERFSREVGRNLGPFFETWGVPTSQAARDSIAGLPVWMPPNFPPTEDLLDGPDLVVESPSVDDDKPDTGGTITFSATVRNGGHGASAATTLRYYRSLDATISSSDTEVGTDAVVGLAAGAHSAESISLTAPSAAGTYHYGGCVDSVSDESDTGNNCSGGVKVEVSAGGPDLVVESPSTSESQLEPGESLMLRATVRNRGDGPSAATTLRYYRSTDSLISATDTDVGTDSVRSLPASATSGESITLSGPSNSGTYYYGACVDSVSGEADTSNNCSTGVKVVVSPAPKVPVPAHPRTTGRFSPSNFSIGQSVDLILSWNRVSGATNYKVYINNAVPLTYVKRGNVCSVRSSHHSSTTTRTSYTYTFRAAAINHYYYFVQACNSSGQCSCP